jgi:L-iditol 2-dehydrogenase
VKALVLKEYRRLSIEDVPLPAIGPDDVLVRVRACGICGSDVHGFDGSTGRRKPPIIMGHEASGEIAQAGPAVTRWKTGDRVTMDSTIFCGRCWHCMRGELNLCDERRVLGVSCEEYRRDGAFAEYVAVPERILHRLPGGLSFEWAAMAEPVSVAVHAVGNANLEKGSTVAVVGAGMIGLLVIQVLKFAGCSQVIAVDLDDSRLELARRLGATSAINSKSGHPSEAIRQMTEGRGADAAFEVVGLSPTLGTALDCVRKGGSVTLVGNLQAKVDLPLQAVVTREITLIGSCASAGEYPASLDLIATGKVDVASLISAAAPLAQGPGWFGRLHAGEKGLMKVLLQP